MNLFSDVIIPLVLVVPLLYFRNFLPSFANEKGKNLATKQDIGEITRIAEGIKNELTQKTEELKAQLLLINQHKLSIKNAEREAIFNYNSKLSAWIYFLVRFAFSKYNLDNFNELDKHFDEEAKRQYELDVAEAHLTLFLNDPQFLKLKMDLTTSVIEYSRLLSKTIVEAKYVFRKAEITIEHHPENKMDIGKEMNEELKSLLDTYRKTSLEQYSKIHKLHTQMGELLYKKVELLSDQDA